MEVTVYLCLLLLGWVLIVFVRSEIASTRPKERREEQHKEADEQEQVEDEFEIMD